MPEDKLYNVVVNFIEPVEGMVVVTATTPDEAKAKALETFKHRRELSVIDAFEVQDQMPLPFNMQGDIEVI